MAKQRDPVLDSMRGIGIVLMVLGHSGFPGTDYIYLFHMALFFMLSGWFFSLRGGLVHFVRRKLVTLWLPFVAANTVFTVCNNLFLRLNILTADARIAEIPGNSVTAPVSIKDIIGRTVHWCVFDGGTQLGGAVGFGSGLTGVGGPVLSVPLMVILGFSPLTAIATSQVIQITAALSGSAGNLAHGFIDADAAVWVTAAELVGVTVGARLAHSISQASLKKVVSVVCIVVGAFIILRACI